MAYESEVMSKKIMLELVTNSYLLMKSDCRMKCAWGGGGRLVSLFFAVCILSTNMNRNLIRNTYTYYIII